MIKIPNRMGYDDKFTMFHQINFDGVIDNHQLVEDIGKIPKNCRKVGSS